MSTTSTFDLLDIEEMPIPGVDGHEASAEDLALQTMLDARTRERNAGRSTEEIVGSEAWLAHQRENCLGWFSTEARRERRERELQAKAEREQNFAYLRRVERQRILARKTTPLVAQLFRRVEASRAPRRRPSSSPRRARAPASSSSDDDPAGPARAAFTRLFLDALVRDDPIWPTLRVSARAKWGCSS